MPNQRPQDTQAVDRWLHLALVQQYGGTVRDPLPDALKKLLGVDEG